MKRNISGILTPKSTYYTNSTATGVTELSGLESSLKLYPNPVMDELTISFTVSDKQHIFISLADMMGREIAVIANGAYAMGAQTLSFGTSSLSRGLYLLRVQTDDETITRKVILQ